MQVEIFDIEVGCRLKSFRKRKGFSQGQFGDRLGVRQAAISKIENGTQKLEAFVLFNLKEIFDIDVNWLITGEDTQPTIKASSLLHRAEHILSSDNLDAIDTLEQGVRQSEQTIEKEKKHKEEIETIKKELAESKKHKCEDGKHCPGEPSSNEKAA